MSAGAAERWAHQPVAVAAVVEALRYGGRATVESACGTGKTRIAARAAARLAPAGRVLVTVPTLELVAQMLQALAGHGGVALGRVVAVCSDTEVVAAAELGLAAADAAVTTDAAQLAALTAVPGRVTVLCTYQSLRVLAAGHARHGLPAWDLAVIDEAHRTAGRQGRAWALIHDDVVIPAVRRLYMTATRKILAPGGEDSLVSMDDEKIYGPVVFRLTASEGIRRGLLADYQVLVVVVTDGQVRALAEAGEHALQAPGGTVSPRALATQIAVLRAAAEYGVRRAITYHNRVAGARAWARQLPAALEMMPAAERPAAVTAWHVYGGQPPAERREILGQLTGGSGGEDGRQVRVVCNARVLTEGVDAPAVDAIVLVDPRNSVIDTVQAVGRALRRGDRPGKIAKIIVPVFLSPGEDPESALEGSAYAQVWQVIRALRAHDDRLAALLDTARTRIGETRAGGQPSPPAGQNPDWLRVCGAPVPADFAGMIQLRAVEEAASSWMEHYGAARTFHAAHGHLDLPVSYETPGGLKLGQWLRAQRRHRARLSPERARMLDQIAMVWDRPDLSWPKGLAAARAWADGHAHGLHDIPAGYAHDGVVLSRWLTLRRREHRAGTLAPGRRAALDAIDPTWHSTDVTWERLYDAARAYLAEHGDLRPDPGYLAPGGLDLPAWLAGQRTRHRAGELRPDRRERLDAIGMPWSVLDDDWQRGLAAARAWAAAWHNLDVPTEHADSGGFPLGQWLATRRRRAAAGRLAPERHAALTALDPGWQTARSRQSRWDTQYKAARAYAARHGRLPTRRGAARDPAPEGPDFRPWLREQRQLARRGQLTPERHALLDALDPGWRGSGPATPPAAGPQAPSQEHHQEAR